MPSPTWSGMLYKVVIREDYIYIHLCSFDYDEYKFNKSLFIYKMGEPNVNV